VLAVKLPEHVSALALDIETAPDGAVLVSVPAVPGLGYASTAPIRARCRCGAWVEPTPHAALTSLYQRVATRAVTLYGSIGVCARCARRKE
jgi:hypothetical protein